MTGASTIVRDPREDDSAVKDLRRRLDEFYSTTTSYTAFGDATPVNAQAAYHDEVARLVQRFPLRRRVRVLELGAGRATFPVYASSVRQRIVYHAQDVTSSNRAYLEGVSDVVHIDDISNLTGEYDLIFSTFVFEHVAAPRRFLEHVDRLLGPGGVHAIFCPRYDMPGYVCPSLRHLSGISRIRTQAALLIARVCARVSRRPQFLVNTDPAMFHGPWYRDADAVHLVSQFDAEQWHRAAHYIPIKLRPVTRGKKDWVLKRLLQLSVAFQKAGLAVDEGGG